MKKIGLTLFLASLILFIPGAVLAQSRLNTSSLRSISLPTPTPTPSVAPRIPLPTPTPSAAPQIQSTSIPRTLLPTPAPGVKTSEETNPVGTLPQAYHIKITYPNGGETFALDGAYYPISVEFNLDEKYDGKYKFQFELWRFGKKIGNISMSPQAFPLENLKTGFGMSKYHAGGYYKGGGAPENYFVAEAGSGYRVRVAVYLDDKLVFSDESDKTITYTSVPSEGNPSVTLIAPNGGEAFELGKGGDVEFSYKALDPYKEGRYSSALELWKDGKRLGPLIGGHNTLTGKDGDLGISVNIDTYVYEYGDYKVLHAAPESGYKLRVFIKELGKEIAHDDSDATFSYIQPKPSILNLAPINFIRSAFEGFLKLFAKK